MEAGLVAETLSELAEDAAISAVHIGMLGSGEVAGVVAKFIRDRKLRNLVLDPVLKSSSGADLLDSAGKSLLVKELFPIASVITPNVAEAAAFTGLKVSNLEEAGAAAAKLHKLGAAAVVVTGGHLAETADLLSVSTATGIWTKVFRGKKIRLTSTHGTGCAFATSLACHLALGQELAEAVRAAKTYVAEAIAHAYPVGRGVGPVNHLYAIGTMESK